ncbi:MAG: MutH/Sau3AI family endonuclease [Candidatus Dojkabacteria bacterium]|nr:MAG: MutH/Sau3AI family endonuclease [Candidatus Dojkabacteria bacterium]
MEIITRKTAIDNLQKYVGHDLSEWATKFEITSFKEDKQNKGWKGQVLERLAGLTNNNSPAPNGIGFELKSVSYVLRNGVYLPRETMAITMINQKQLIDTPFFESHCWDKLKSLILCAVEWKGKMTKHPKLLDVASFDLLTTDTIVKEIEADYEFIRNKLIISGFESLTGKDGKWIQARTKGPGHGSISRAFYARKSLLAELFKKT